MPDTSTTRSAVATTRPVIDVSAVAAWDTTVDVVVVGSGGSGLVAAVAAATTGSDVLVVEKATESGGTTRKSGGGVWVPANHHMARLALDDSRDGALRYMARTARPHLFDAGSPTLGLPADEFELLEVFYDHGGAVFEELERIGALSMLALPDMPNYYCAIAADAQPYGRTLGPVRPNGEPGDGTEMIRQLSDALSQSRGRIETDHRVVACVIDGERVVGLVCDTPTGRRTIRAAQGVVLASGGFTHNERLRRTFLPGPVFGGCASVSNEGDVIPIVQALGAEMHNMTEAWNVPIVLERALAHDPALHGTFNIVGDAMLCVNRFGRRTFNEKIVYHEATAAMLQFDGIRSEYPNMLMIPIWDQVTYDSFRGSPYDGGMMPALGDDDRHVMSAPTIDELAELIDERLEQLGPSTGGTRLSAEFTQNLHAAIERFNGQAAAGCDDDFHRGETLIERHMHRLAINAAKLGPGSGMTAMASVGWAVPVENDAQTAGNPTIAPLASTGPYHASILCAGTLDTKGGPRVDGDGRVMRSDGSPIAGVYAVGNCAGSATGQAYWGAGGTLGPMVVYAWLAGQHAAQQPRFVR